MDGKLNSANGTGGGREQASELPLDTACVTIRSVGNKNPKEIKSAGERAELTSGKTGVILLSPFAKHMNPLVLDAEIRVAKNAGVDLKGVAILSNYAYNKASEMGKDASKLRDERLQNFLLSGERLVHEKLDEEFDSELNPGASYRRVIDDHKLPVIYGKDINSEVVRAYYSEYQSALKQDRDDIISCEKKMAEEFVRKHNHAIDTVGTDNSIEFLRKEGPEYAALIELYDLMIYAGGQSDLMKIWSSFVDEESQGDFVEVNILQPLNARDAAAKEVELEKKGRAISHPKYAKSTRSRSDSDADAEIRTNLLGAVARGDLNQANEIMAQIDVSKRPDLRDMVDSVSGAVQEVCSLKQEEIVLRKRSVALKRRSLEIKRNGMFGDELTREKEDLALEQEDLEIEQEELKLKQTTANSRLLDRLNGFGSRHAHNDSDGSLLRQSPSRARGTRSTSAEIISCFELSSSSSRKGLDDSPPQSPRGMVATAGTGAASPSNFFVDSKNGADGEDVVGKLLDLTPGEQEVPK